MSTETTDPFVALATELTLLGRRLDGMGAELLHLRATAGPVASGPAPVAGTAPWSRSGDARRGEEVASEPDPDPGAAASSTAAGDRTGDAGQRRPEPTAHPGGQIPAGGGPSGGAQGQAHPAGWPYAGDPGYYARQPQYPGQRPYPERVASPEWQTRQRDSGYPAGPAPTPPRTAGFPAFGAGSGARLLAWVGGGVTLLGVVLLLVLAASRGWFAPPARVGAGAVLGLVLVGLALWLHRKENAKAGALALAATGFATLYLVVAAATALYGYLPEVPALLVALVVAGGGLGLADHWRSQLLGGGVIAGAAVLAPAITTDWLLVALVLALQVAALPVVLRRHWSVLMLIAAAGPVLYGCAVGADQGLEGRPVGMVIIFGVLAVGLGTAWLASRVLPPNPVVSLVAATPVPLLVAAGTLGDLSGGLVAAVAALALGGLAAVPGTDRRIRVVACAAAAVALFQATLMIVDGSGATAVVLGAAVVAAVVAAALRSRLPLYIAMAYGTFGTLVALTRDAPLSALVEFPGDPYDRPGTAAILTGAGLSALVLALAVALLVAGGRVGLIRPDARSAGLWVPIGLVGLYGATSVVVTIALLVSDDRTGFTAGHAIVTVSWTVGALVLLARGISRPALRITGLVLVAAAVAKLVLFDLVALDGLARVAAFLGAGLVLLAAGTRYARLVAEAEAEARPGRAASLDPPTDPGFEPRPVSQPGEAGGAGTPPNPS